MDMVTVEDDEMDAMVREGASGVATAAVNDADDAGAAARCGNWLGLPSATQGPEAEDGRGEKVTMERLQAATRAAGG